MLIFTTHYPPIRTPTFRHRNPLTRLILLLGFWIAFVPVILGDLLIRPVNDTTAVPLPIESYDIYASPDPPIGAENVRASINAITVGPDCQCSVVTSTAYPAGVVPPSTALYLVEWLSALENGCVVLDDVVRSTLLNSPLPSTLPVPIFGFIDTKGSKYTYAGPYAHIDTYPVDPRGNSIAMIYVSSALFDIWTVAATPGWAVTINRAKGPWKTLINGQGFQSLRWVLFSFNFILFLLATTFVAVKYYRRRTCVCKRRWRTALHINGSIFLFVNLFLQPYRLQSMFPRILTFLTWAQCVFAFTIILLSWCLTFNRVRRSKINPPFFFTGTFCIVNYFAILLIYTINMKTTTSTRAKRISYFLMSCEVTISFFAQIIYYLIAATIYHIRMVREKNPRSLRLNMLQLTAVGILTLICGTLQVGAAVHMTSPYIRSTAGFLASYIVQSLSAVLLHVIILRRLPLRPHDKVATCTAHRNRGPGKVSYLDGPKAEDVVIGKVGEGEAWSEFTSARPDDSHISPQEPEWHTLKGKQSREPLQG